MCWMAAIPMALSAAQTMSSQHSEDKVRVAQINASRQQSIEMLKQTNVQNASSRLQQQDALESASSDLTARSMQKVQAMGTIRAAIGESGLEGNSFDRISRLEEGKYIREANSVTDNYERDYASLFHDQLSRTESTASQIDQATKSEPKGKSGLQKSLEVGFAVGKSAAGSYASGSMGGK